ncbi:MAG: hypothetical protein ACYDCN_09890 [Bacteroidia bacterium]
MKYILYILLFFSCTAWGQTSADFSIKWFADSTGKMLYRSKSLTKDSISNEITKVGGLDLKGMSKKKIIKLLGAPNKITKDKTRFIFDYFLAPYCGFSEEGCYRWVLELTFENDQVKSFYSSYINTK